mmetsp:Transcript_30046/g.96966  ORF Transcript_30046/g.96966 Transcript_30046/m.96966 type:complete len:551 (-) Transcript_30046:671-2323(-)
MVASLAIFFLPALAVAFVAGPPAPRPPSRPLWASSTHEVDVCVVGSGVSGSSLAHFLSSSKSVLLAEARDEVGGNVISKEAEGFVWEEGPNSFQPTPTIMRLAHEVGISDELVLADKSLPPWVLWDGKLRPLPKNLPGDLLNFDLLSWPGKIRAGLGAVGLLLEKAPMDKEETIQEFVTRHLGKECFERIIEPFVSGVYAGDPTRLSMRSALRKIFRLQTLSFNGGLVPGAFVRFAEIAEEKKANPPDPAWPTYEAGELGSFRKGLQTLPLAVKAKLEGEGSSSRVETGWTLIGLEQQLDKNNKWKATFRTTEGEEVTVIAKAVAVTAPARNVADVVAPLSTECAEALRKVYSPPVCSVTVAYPKTAFRNPDLPGFGSLNPRSQGVRTLGTIWSSSLFPNRCPSDYNLLLNYIGGSRDANIMDLSDDEILQAVDEGCRKSTILKPEAPPPKLLGLRRWPSAIPQYHLNYQKDVLDELDAFEAKFPGLTLGGNYRTGVAFGDCAQFGLDHANKLRTSLEEEAAAQRGEEEEKDTTTTTMEKTEERELVALS